MSSKGKGMTTRNKRDAPIIVSGLLALGSDRRSIRRVRDSVRCTVGTGNQEVPNESHPIPVIDSRHTKASSPHAHNQPNAIDSVCATIPRNQREYFNDKSDMVSCPDIGSSRQDNEEMESDWRVVGKMPGGPQDGSVIPSYGGHVARKIWDGVERPMITLYTRPMYCKKLASSYQSLDSRSMEIVKNSGLSHLPDTMFPEFDLPLIAAFVERWQPDTNSFHLPFGEMTILLHDVWHILRIPVDGVLPYDREPIDPSLAKNYLMSLFGYAEGTNATFDGDGIVVKGGVVVNKLLELSGKPSEGPEVRSAAWLLAVTGVCLFTDKSRMQVRPYHHGRLSPSDAHSTAWGTMTLAYLYRELGIASRFGCKGIGGCLTLLQAWIYEHFICFRPRRSKVPTCADAPRAKSWDVRHERRDMTRLASYRRMLDCLTPEQVTWTPYENDPSSSCPRTTYYGCIGYYDIIEPYMPDRCLRQLGYMQRIPFPILEPPKAERPQRVASYMVTFPQNVLVSWVRFEVNSLVMSKYQQIVGPVDVVEDYMSWYTTFSHPRIMPANGDMELVEADETSKDWLFDLLHSHVDALMELPRDESFFRSPYFQALSKANDQCNQLFGRPRR